MLFEKRPSVSSENWLRQVMTLLLEDLSYAEIAEALGLSLSNVGVRVNRAKAQLRTMLDDA